MNYIRFDSNGYIVDRDIKGIVATSNDADIINIFYDNDASTETTAYRTKVRVRRADGHPIGPTLLTLSSVSFDTQLEAEKYGTATYNVETEKWDVACRKLSLTNEMLGVKGDVGISIIYDQVNELGAVLSTDVNQMIVIKVLEAVDEMLTEEEFNNLVEFFLPRDLGDLTDGIKPDLTQKIIIRQAGETKLITLEQLNTLLEDGVTDKDLEQDGRLTTNESDIANLEDGTTVIPTYELKANKNVANGYVGLDTNAKIPLIFLYDVVLGQLEYAGSFNPNNGYPAQTNALNPNRNIRKGDYFIANANGTISGVEYNTGDWAVRGASDWQKIDNTDAVASVNGKIGIVNLTGANINVSGADTTTIADKITEMDTIIEQLKSLYDLEESVLYNGSVGAINVDYANITGTSFVIMEVENVYSTDGEVTFKTQLDTFTITTDTLMETNYNQHFSSYNEDFSSEGSIWFELYNNEGYLNYYDSGGNELSSYPINVKLTAYKMKPLTAENMGYDNSLSGLTADNVQEAIDELVINIGDVNVEVTDAHVSSAKNKTFTTIRNRFEEIEQGIKSDIKNYIEDGNFTIDANGDGLADNFRLPADVTGTLSGGIQSFTPIAQYNSLQYFPIIGNSIDRYYITALVKSNKSTTQLRIKDVSGTPNVPHSGSGQFERLSMIGVLNGTNRAVYIIELATSAFTEIQVSKMMAINLNAFKIEPTIEELDEMAELFGEYFEGELNPNETQEAFLKSWREKRTEVDDKIREVLNTVETKGGNLYKKELHFTANKLSNIEGAVATSSNWGLAMVPVNELMDYSVQLPNFGTYNGNIGSVAFYQDDTLLDFIYPASSEVNGQYNGIDYITVTTPANCNKLHVTAKASGIYDDSDTLIVVESATLNEETLVGYLKAFAGATVPTVEDYLPYKGKIIACLGDSLTGKNETAPINYTDLIAERMGFDVRNFGVGGTGYMRSHAEGTAFYQRAVNLPSDADIITIFGSGNDLAHFATLGVTKDTFDEENKTIAGCINHTIDIIQTNHPRAQLGIIAPTPWSTTPTTSGNQMGAYVDLLEAICKSRGVPFLNLYRRSNLRPWESINNSLFFYNSDGTHPNNDGHEMFIYPPFREFIKSLM